MTLPLARDLAARHPRLHPGARHLRPPLLKSCRRLANQSWPPDSLSQRLGRRWFASLAAHLSDNGHLNGDRHPPRWCPAHGPALPKNQRDRKPLLDGHSCESLPSGPLVAAAALASTSLVRADVTIGVAPARWQAGLRPRHPRGQRHEDVAHQHLGQNLKVITCVTTRPTRPQGRAERQPLPSLKQADLVIGSARHARRRRHGPLAGKPKPCRSWSRPKPALPPSRTPGTSTSPSGIMAHPWSSTHEGPGHQDPRLPQLLQPPTARLAQGPDPPSWEKNGGGIKIIAADASPTLTPPVTARALKLVAANQYTILVVAPAPAQPYRTRAWSGAATKARSTRRTPPPRAT